MRRENGGFNPESRGDKKSGKVKKGIVTGLLAATTFTGGELVGVNLEKKTGQAKLKAVYDAGYDRGAKKGIRETRTAWSETLKDAESRQLSPDQIAAQIRGIRKLLLEQGMDVAFVNGSNGAVEILPVYKIPNMDIEGGKKGGKTVGSKKPTAGKGEHADRSKEYSTELKKSAKDAERNFQHITPKDLLKAREGAETEVEI
ncbi:hypothetical protein EPN28_04770 [Patescibacteria group bacterium]|nr:MAG: hypothetical protein EPN28_04770 [Patescibacteria group bacterium]